MRLTSLFLALLLIGGLTWWFALRGPEVETPADQAADATPPAQAAGEPPVEVVVIDSRAAPVADILTLRGRTEPRRRVVVTAETEGRVISPPPRKGERVAEGEVLCRLDPGARPSRLAEAEARLAEAEIEASAASQLAERGFSPRTVEAAREAGLQAARAQVELIELEIDRLAIRAPFDGVLEEDATETGARLGIGDVCARIADLSSLEVTGFVSELEVDRLALGQETEVHLVNGLEAKGRISYIAPLADLETRTYEVEVTVPNADGRLRAGMTAETAVALPPAEAHRLPQSALTLDDEGRMGVRTVEDGTARFHPVRILRETPEAIWVTGLPEAAQVIVQGQEFVRVGRAVVAVPLAESALR